MHVLSQIVESLRLRGAIVREGHARGDWCVSSHLLPGDVANLASGSGPVIAYHYIQTGLICA